MKKKNLKFKLKSLKDPIREFIVCGGDTINIFNNDQKEKSVLNIKFNSHIIKFLWFKFDVIDEIECIINPYKFNNGYENKKEMEKQLIEKLKNEELIK